MTSGVQSLDLGQLLRYPREDLSIEIKNWLDLSDEMARANIAKAILALANWGGGYVVLGFSEIEGQHVPADDRPPSLSAYNQDTVNDIVSRYADPPFQCAVHHVQHPDDGNLFPIIVVPGGHRTPIRAKRDDPDRKHVQNNCYYTRRAGPSSDQPRSPREWDDLIKRCIIAGRDDLLDSFRKILYGLGEVPETKPATDNARIWERECVSRFETLVATQLADETPSRYANGIWTAAYVLEGDFTRPDQIELLELLRRVKGHETGWPPWWVPTKDGIAPYPIDGIIECWLKESISADGAHSDFWRVSPEGRCFLLRGHHEDSEGGFAPGAVLVYSSVIWEVGQILLHLRRFAMAVGTEGTATLRMRWTGLTNRRLSSWRGGSYDYPKRTCRQDVVESEVRIDTQSIDDALPELVGRVTKPLFTAFDFYTASPQLLQREVDQLRHSRVG
jgi:hypothetical protein